ncbi:FIST C-terminal domain-containing protein [Rhodobacteraceae bacterium B1Z28]|uniref:FIST C-terminal domain-containing protein n=2 Tax=Ruegeria haliotis TaxID=2747601 RepID=A0ABX2PTJ5_9RHOB|nr:FIST C-terminal domain-containing protein [Ruegeria haliotis]
MQELEQGPKFIGMGRSQALDPYVAVNEACAEIDCALSCFVLAFIPNELDPAEVTRALNYKLAGVPVFGCTTAGQITVKGYESDALLLLAFPKANFRCSSILFENIRPLNSTEVAAKAQRQVEKFRHTAGWNRLALMFSDGLSKQEDLLVSTLETVLDGLPIFGGSAGDGLQYEETFVLHNGEIHCNASVLLQIETNLQFQGIGFDHFLPIGSEIIITDADPEERMVYEINGAPAALEYARLVGCAAEDLSPQVFAENPMLLRQNLNYYVRAIREVTDGQALSFLAAIDDGLIMTLGRGKEIIETLEAGLDIHDSAGKSPDFILGFDCVLRKLEIEQKQLSRQVSDVLQTRRVIGFNTYGEQQSGVHMNQTFVGVAFFEPVVRDLS